MNTAYSITSKHQVTVPKDVREKLGVKERGRLTFKEDEGRIFIEKVPTMAEVAAEMQADLKRRGWNKKVTQKDMDRAREVYYKEGGRW